MQCRACLVSAPTMEYIDLDDVLTNGTTYLDCFNECTHLYASIADCFTHIVCRYCAQKLQNVYDFVHTARFSDTQLRIQSGSSEIYNDIKQLKFDNMNQLNIMYKLKKHVENNEKVTRVKGGVEELFSEDDSETNEEDLLDEKPSLKSQIVSQKFNQINFEEECDDRYLLEYVPENLENNFNHSKWKCKVCHLIFRGDVSYEGHMNWHKGVWPYKCLHCECGFRCKDALDQHVNMCHHFKEFIKVFNCHVCRKTFRLQKLLLQHFQLEHHQNENQDGCAEIMKEKPKLMPAITDHNQISDMSENLSNEIWKCDICNRQLRSESSLHNHTRNVHMQGTHKTEVDEVKCELCMRQLLRRNIDKHMALHARKDRPTKFVCTYCLRECKSKKALCQHEKIHQGESPMVVYVCSDCDRQYNSQYLLQQHRKQVHKERDNVCPICGNSFKLRNQLMNHIKLHLEKNIACPQCDKRYSRQVDLNVHMRTHTGELPFACHLCEKRFAIKVRLTYHLQKHYGVKHACKECDAEFNSRLKLKAHSFKHTGMPYRCDACDHDGFPNRYIFKRHLLRVHNTTMSDEELVCMFQRNTGKTIRIRRISDSEQITVESAIDTNVVFINNDEI